MTGQFQIRKLVIAAVLLAGLVSEFPDEPSGAWGNRPRWGDQGDGTYRNPVLPADYSDLDCIRTCGVDFISYDYTCVRSAKPVASP